MLLHLFLPVEDLRPVGNQKALPPPVSLMHTRVQFYRNHLAFQPCWNTKVSPEPEDSTGQSGLHRDLQARTAQWVLVKMKRKKVITQNQLKLWRTGSKTMLERASVLVCRELELAMVSSISFTSGYLPDTCAAKQLKHQLRQKNPLAHVNLEKTPDILKTR